MADKKEKKAPADKKQNDLARNGGKKAQDNHDADTKDLKAALNPYAEEGDTDWKEIEPGSADDPMVIEGQRKYDDNRGGGRGQVGQGNQSGALGTNN